MIETSSRRLQIFFVLLFRAFVSSALPNLDVYVLKNPSCSLLYKQGLINNLTLTAVVGYEYAPFIFWHKDSKNNTYYTGLTIDLLEIIGKNLKCKFNIIQPSDDYFGVEINGTWYGLIGMLSRKEADVAAAGLIMTYPRSAVADFSAIYHFQYMGILIRRPQEPVSLVKVFSVFDSSAWWLILAVIIGGALGTYFMNNLDPYNRSKSIHKSLLNCFWWVYEVITLQAGPIKHVHWPSKIFQVAWRYTIFLVIATFIGNLTAVLTTQRTYLPFKDLKGLANAVDQGFYKICIVPGTSFFSAVLAADLPEYQILSNFLRKHPEYSPATIYECEERLLNEPNVAFINELTYLEFLEVKYCNEMILLNDRFTPSYFCFGFQKNSPLNSIISQIITETVDKGLVQLWLKKYAAQNKFCNVISVDEIYHAQSVQLSMYNIGIAFLILLGGNVVGFLLLSFEKLWKRY